LIFFFFFLEWSKSVKLRRNYNSKYKVKKILRPDGELENEKSSRCYLC
jgi:hypothetical protein